MRSLWPGFGWVPECGGSLDPRPVGPEPGGRAAGRGIDDDCDGTTDPAETCHDNIDNDCDGTTDEECGCGGSAGTPPLGLVAFWLALFARRILRKDE